MINYNNMKTIFTLSTAAFALLWGFLSSGNIILIDTYINSLIPALHSDILSLLFISITSIFNTSIFLLWFLPILAYLAYKKRWYYALFLFFGVAGGQAIKIITKGLTDKARPENPFNLPIHESSFPSGHATTSVFLFLAFLYLLMPVVPSRYRLTFQVFCLSGMVLVPLSRLYTQVHYTSDVLAGVLLGAASFAFTVLVFNYIKTTKYAKYIDNA